MMKEDPEPQRIITPSELDIPAYLMNFPSTVSNRSSNNVWMTNKNEYNYPLAFNQWRDLYNYITGYGIVYLLPSNGGSHLQDLCFVANLGVYLPHVDTPTILISNFCSEVRRGEDILGKRFLTNLGYNIYQPEFFFEGEADLKWIRSNKWIGGYGIRTDKNSYDWMKHKFDMDIITVEMTDKKLYHFDCMFAPIDKNKALVATSIVSKKDLAKIEKVVNIIDIPKGYIYSGWTNITQIGDKILHAPPLGDDEGTREFEKFISRLGYEPVIIHLEEFEKSGADLSCLIFHLNYDARCKLIQHKQEQYINGTVLHG